MGRQKHHHEACCQGCELERVHDDFCLGPVEVPEKGLWSVQIFRSIDTDCADLEPVRLLHKKGILFDMSVQCAYVHNIRRAKRFLYIENQYFMGSSHFWTEARQGCNNIIPIEIAEKISTKILHNEPFHVYINIPMWPEGITTSETVQDIMHWQYLTVEMMYRKVAAALADSGSGASPTDYLTFYCMGKREENTFELDLPKKGTGGARLFDAQRAPIYIHSKLLIVDDEYVLMGSANLNERSMSGTRDTEIAFGAHQPHFITNEGNGPRGHVQAFRLQLWAAHLGIRSSSELEEYREPQTPCVISRVRSRAEQNWQDYTKSEFTKMSGQLMTYPYIVEPISATVSPRGGTSVPKSAISARVDTFPDTLGQIVGPPVEGLVDLLTM